VLSRRRENLLPVHGGAAGTLRGLALRGAALPVLPGRVGVGGVRTSRGGDKIRQQPPGAPGSAGPLFVPIRAGAALDGRPRGARPFFEHPAGKQRQRRLLHHFVQEDGKLPAKICHMFQFRHLEISQRCAGTFPKIVHRRFANPSHGFSPGAEMAMSAAARRGRVTDFHISTSDFSPGEIPRGLGVRNGTYLTLRAGFAVTGYVQRLLR